MTATAAARTPGFAVRLAVWFETNKRNEQVAYYRTSSGRKVRLPLMDAWMWLAQDLADRA